MVIRGRERFSPLPSPSGAFQQSSARAFRRQARQRDGDGNVAGRLFKAVLPMKERDMSAGVFEGKRDKPSRATACYNRVVSGVYGCGRCIVA